MHTFMIYMACVIEKYKTNLLLFRISDKIHKDGEQDA